MNNSALLDQDASEQRPACLAAVTPPQNLYAEVCSRETLVRAARAVFASVLRSPEDAETIAQIEFRLESFLGDLEAELKEHRYMPGLVLRGWRTYEGRAYRTRVLSLKDRIVHTALFIVLEKALENSFAKCDLRDRQSERVLAAIRATALSGSNERDLFAVETDRDPSEDLFLELLRIIARGVLDEELRELMKLFIRAPSLDTPSGVAMNSSGRMP